MTAYICYSAYFMERYDLEDGDKIVLPSNLLYPFLGQLETGEPLTFRIDTWDRKNPKHYHCGVAEFTAPENVIFVPMWLLDELALDEGAIVSLENVVLQKATKVVIRPLGEELYQFGDIKATLEEALRSMTCLTKGTTMKIRHSEMEMSLYIEDVSPDPQVLLHNTDCEVEFRENTEKDLGTHDLQTSSISSAVTKIENFTIKRELVKAQQSVSLPTPVISNQNKFSKISTKFSAFSGKSNKC